MKMKIKEVSDLVGISVRTLHYYDEIGLLTPDETTESGYRFYSENNLVTLQQILFFKELDFPLKKIKEIINSPSFDQDEALRLHRKMLLEKRDRTDKMIATIDKTIRYVKGEIQMSNEEKFEGFDFSHNPYEDEARNLWGEEAIVKTKATLGNSAMIEKMNDIYRRLADIRNTLPESDQAQAGITEWYDFLNTNTGHHYSLDAFKGLGQLYVDDDRFTKNIDQFGQGLALFMRDAMAIYADNHKK